MPLFTRSIRNELIMNQNKIDAFKDDVEQHGEIHVVMEERDRELEIRNNNNVDWDEPCDGLFTIEFNSQIHRFQYDRVVDWYVPEEIWH